MRIDIERLIHSLKAAIACSFAFLLSKIVGLAADPWIVVTVIVVMCAQIYGGSVVQKSYLRFLGTLIGCLLATTTLLIAGDSFLTIFLAIAFAAFLFSYLATSGESLSYTGTLGAVTTVVILMVPHPTPLLASQRFLEISIGILIATLTSQFILPIHARTHLRRAQAKTLEQLRDFYSATMVTHSITTHTDYLELDQSIITALVRQQQLAKESIHELFGEKFNAEHVMLTLYCEREMLRAVSFMHHALAHIHHAETSLAHLPVLEAFNKTTLNSLETLIAVIKSPAAPKEHIHIPNVNALREAILKSVEQGSEEQSIYADGFLFSAKIFTDALGKLAGLYGVMSYNG